MRIESKAMAKKENGMSKRINFWNLTSWVLFIFGFVLFLLTMPTNQAGQGIEVYVELAASNPTAFWLNITGFVMILSGFFSQ